jgi:NTE family protein
MYESSLTARQDGSPVIGLALGSGAARGWAHIGVIAALEQEGIRPDVVCGCSIGALVGAAYVSGKVGQLGEWVSALDWHDVVGMLDLSFRGGLIRGEKVLAHCAQHFFVEDFAEADRPFACVATAGWPTPCAPRSPCRVCSRRSSAIAACWWTEDWSIRCRYRCAARWGLTS